MIFLFQFKKNTMRAGPQNGKSSWSGLTIFLFFFISLYLKMSETTYYKRNREIALNRAKDFYKNN